jgi:hypothetical protein
MDPRDRLSPFASGVACAACGGLVSTDGIRILAQRDDLVFLELTCAGCRSESLGIVVGGRGEDDDGWPVFDRPVGYGEFATADAARFRNAPPIGATDLETARELLRRGGLDGLIGRATDGPDRASP